MTIAVISMIRDNWGGSEELWYQMARLALQRGHKVVHISFETPVKHRKLVELESLGLIHYDRPGWVPEGSTAITTGYLVWNYLRKKIADPLQKVLAHRPDVILYNGTCYSIAHEMSLLRVLSSPRGSSFSFFILGHLNHDWIRTVSDSEASRVREAYRRCKKVFFVSQRNLETAERQLCCSIPQGVVIRNPVNMSYTSPIPFPESSVVQIAVVGNLVTKHKGQDLLIQALSGWKEQGWVLNVYGSGQDEWYLKALVSFYNLEDRILFHGTIENVRSIWEKNHILVLPSHMEGMPLVVVEAMLCGRICLATDVGGNSEWVRHGENGFLAAAPTVPLLVRALQDVWDRKSQWEAIAGNAHKTAELLYDPDAGETLLQHIIAP